jgi:hypothetical protein
MTEVNVPAGPATWFEHAWNRRRTANCARPVSVALATYGDADMLNYAEEAARRALSVEVAKSGWVALTLPAVVWTYVKNREYRDLLDSAEQPYETTWVRGDLESLSSADILICRASVLIVPPIELVD